MGEPQMSVVLITPDRYDTIRKTMKCLRAQTVRDQLEIVIVAPSAKGLNLEESESKEFCQFRVVEVGAIKSVGRARATGIREASAPVVVLAEDHCYPNRRWAEALIDAHRQPWAAVGPVIANANPGTKVSWASFFIGYGPWVGPAEAGLIDDLPGHNSSYKRAILLDYGPELEVMLEAESVLHWDMQAKGYRLYLEPRAKTYHLNFTRPSAFLRALFHFGRMFAGTRGASVVTGLAGALRRRCAAYPVGSSPTHSAEDKTV
jgi:glycosyltransferase involved in cell wall biosynthesis